jgi:transposase
VCQHLAGYYSHTGRPSIAPELMIRVLIIGYCFGIRSERRLCEGVHLNLAYRWFCQLGLENSVPDHSTFSKNRRGRFRESDTFRHLFESVLQRCMTEGLVRGEGFATDASIIKADAQRQRGVRGCEPIDWGNPEAAARPVREYLAALEELFRHDAQDYFADRSRCNLDCGTGWAGFLCLFNQLPDRPEGGDHRRCRSVGREQGSGSRSDPNHD